jgi:hypothetical protein
LRNSSRSTFDRAPETLISQRKTSRLKVASGAVVL